MVVDVRTEGVAQLDLLAPPQRSKGVHGVALPRRECNRPIASLDASVSAESIEIVTQARRLVGVHA